jgi:hypothetical protein
MNILFPDETAFPEGFIYHFDFITREEEQNLLVTISKIELHSFLFQGFVQTEAV